MRSIHIHTQSAFSCVLHYLITFALASLCPFAVEAEEEGEVDLTPGVESVLREAVSNIGQLEQPEVIRRSVQSLSFSFNFEDGMRAGLAAARAVSSEHGPFVGVEFLGDRELGVSLFALFYLQKFQSNALYWRFMVYRPDPEGDEMYVIAAKWGAAGSILTEIVPTVGGRTAAAPGANDKALRKSDDIDHLP